MTNNCLIIDFGNSFIKAGIYSKSQNKILEIASIPQNGDAKQLLDKFTCLQKDIKVDLVVESNTCKKHVAQKFNDSLKAVLKDVEIKIISRQDFNGIVDTSKIASNVIIGTDILLLAYYGISTLNKGAIFSLGSVYFGVIFQNGEVINVLLTPSIVRGLNASVAFGAIDETMIPTTFDKTVGLNTPDAFAAGVNFLIDGYIDNVIGRYYLPASNVLITGGEAPKFQMINKKYKYEKDLVLISLARFVKAKSW